MTLAPDSQTRRSFIYRKLLEANASFAEVNGGAVAMSLAGESPDRAASLGLCDISVFPRTGFKGADALAWMAGRGVTLEPRPNTTFQQPGGGLAAVLAPGEAVLLAPLSGDGAQIDTLDGAWSLDIADRAYRVPRANTNFEFIISGNHAAKMFAKICGVDLRGQSFANLAIAQTSIARTNSIVIRNDLGTTPAFRMLGDSASAEYMWECLLDAMDEFGGAPVGLDAVRNLAA
ncbi:MAG: sarcosine oxidase [Rhodospirillaceae bacterium]|nr:sarcosine oxidase [Rhodospirillaceae bacterium]